MKSEITKDKISVTYIEDAGFIKYPVEDMSVSGYFQLVKFAIEEMTRKGWFSSSLIFRSCNAFSTNAIVLQDQDTMIRQW